MHNKALLSGFLRNDVSLVWETACAESKWWTWREEIEGKVVHHEKSVEQIGLDRWLELLVL
jgi:hypothetical protein